MIKLAEIWITQRSLNRIDDIPAMAADPSGLPPVLLDQSPDGSIEVQNGHHRLHAYWIAGRRFLEFGEYILVQVDYNKTRFYRLEDSPWLRKLNTVSAS